ncbi:MAG: hypothetical protein KAR87_05880 [Candidatus Aenigmarchaeota archaeon]|nr:hypothetical protein [Candidatus Aenigmarchaeota archaeon]
MGNNSIIKPCAESNVFEIHQKKKHNLNLDSTADCLKKKYKIIVVTPHLAVVEQENKRTNIFKNGRLLIKNVDEGEANKIAKEIEACFSDS